MENHKADNSTSLEKAEPIEKFGVRIMSLGFLLDKDRAAIWRGPMASKVLTQLIDKTNWGKLDFLFVDMPPGTGDISITLAKKLPESKAIIVITPQELAVSDGRKAASMFKAKGMDVAMLGVVENMSWFTPKKHPDEKYFLFGQGGGRQLADELIMPLLSQIPLVSVAYELSDTGKTTFASSDEQVKVAYETLVDNIINDAQIKI